MDLESGLAYFGSERPLCAISGSRRHHASSEVRNLGETTQQKVMSDRVRLARYIAARTEPRFIEIKPKVSVQFEAFATPHPAVARVGNVVAGNVAPLIRMPLVHLDARAALHRAERRAHAARQFVNIDILQNFDRPLVFALGGVLATSFFRQSASRPTRALCSDHPCC